MAKKKKHAAVRLVDGVKDTLSFIDAVAGIPYKVRDVLDSIGMMPEVADDIRNSWPDTKRVLLQPQSIVLGEDVFTGNGTPPPSTKEIFSEGILLDYKKKYAKESPILFGRESEQRAIKETFLSRRCPNALLVAKAGLGKSAIANYLMHQIATGNAGKSFIGANAYEFNIQNFANNGKRIGFKDVAKAVNGNSYMFADELHTMSKYQLDSMKSMLSEGEIKLLAATTPKELEMMTADSVSPDALLRRFNIIEISEPTPDIVLQMLKHNRDGMQDEYGIALPDDMLEYLVEQSTDIKSDIYHSPAKEERLLDNAAANAMLNFEEQYDEIATTDKVALGKANIDYAVKMMTN